MKDGDQRFGDDADAKAEWQSFLSDNRHIRFEDSQQNWNSMFGFLKEHALYFNREALHFAYATLRDTLELTPLATPVEQPPAPVPAQPPTPIPTAQTRQEPTIWRNGKKIQFRNATRL